MSSTRRMLTEADREEISRGIAENVESRVIAEWIGRDPSIVSREVGRHGGPDGYRARAADVSAVRIGGRSGGRWRGRRRSARARVGDEAGAQAVGTAPGCFDAG